MAHHRNRSLIVAAVGGLAGLLGTYVAYMLLGVATGVIAMCSWAPNWWVHVYFALAFSIPVVSVWLALEFRRSYLRRHEGAGA
jgi:branched-subunit amino acid ABC-type transport system permease component